jgi:crossover junction endodeoxyribonuclease RusA
MTAVDSRLSARRVEIDVRGLPRPQGSMQLFKNGGAKYPAAVYVWRGQVQAAVAALEEPIILGAVELRLGFDLPRPLAHFGTGRNAGTVKASAPPHPITIPDLDKLVRCVSDAITDAGLWHDDSQVVSAVTAKRYGGQPGVHIVVTELT